MKFTDIGGRAPILQVAITLSGNVTRDTNGSTTVGNTRAESADVSGLVAAGETHVIVVPVDGDMLIMPL